MGSENVILITFFCIRLPENMHFKGVITDTYTIKYTTAAAVFNKEFARFDKGFKQLRILVFVQEYRITCCLYTMQSIFIQCVLQCEGILARADSL